MTKLGKWAGRALVTAIATIGLTGVAQAWEPTKPVEFVVPAGTGGGADQMARFIQGIVAKNKLMAQPLVVVNKSGGAGAEGFLEVKGAKGDPHKIIITLSNLFTTPLATGVPFNWRDLTPGAMLALDQFVLWVNADAPYKTAKEYIDDIKAKPANTFKMAGTGSKQEDQVMTALFAGYHLSGLAKAGDDLDEVVWVGIDDIVSRIVQNHMPLALRLINFINRKDQKGAES